jgi:hypothetical protein
MPYLLAMTTTHYSIPAENLSSLKGHIEKLNKKVAKLQKKGFDVKPIDMTVGPAIITKGMQRGIEVERIHFPVSMSYEPIKAAGWEFVATLGHEEAGNIVSAVPGMTTEGELAAYRTAKPACNHCGFSRKRNDTFILRKTVEG